MGLDRKSSNSKTSKPFTPFIVWDMVVSIIAALVIILTLSNVYDIPVFRDGNLLDKILIVVGVAICCFFCIISRELVLTYHKTKFFKWQCSLAIKQITKQGYRVAVMDETAKLVKINNFKLIDACYILRKNNLPYILLDSDGQPLVTAFRCDKDGNASKALKLYLSDSSTNTISPHGGE